MEPYLFRGVVLPERAQLSLEFGCSFSHPGTGSRGTVRVSVILNKVAVWVESEHQWDIYTLRNVVRSIVQDYLAMIGYLNGYAYDLEMTRALNRGLEIDLVFGIDTPRIAESRERSDLNEALTQLRQKTEGPNGVYLRRCFQSVEAGGSDGGGGNGGGKCGKGPHPPCT